MRTTLNIDDAVLAKVRQYAEDRSMTLREAVNLLLEQGLRTLGVRLDHEGLASTKSERSS